MYSTIKNQILHHDFTPYIIGPATMRCQSLPHINQLSLCTSDHKGRTLIRSVGSVIAHSSSAFVDASFFISSTRIPGSLLQDYPSLIHKAEHGWVGEVPSIRQDRGSVFTSRVEVSLHILVQDTVVLILSGKAKEG